MPDLTQLVLSSSLIACLGTDPSTLFARFLFLFLFLFLFYFYFAYLCKKVQMLIEKTGHVKVPYDKIKTLGYTAKANGYTKYSLRMCC